MFERYTDRARRVVVLAQEEARMFNHNYIGTEHLLLGLIHEGEGVAAQALKALGISLDGVRSQVEEIIGQGQQAPAGHIPFTPRGKKVLELSLREALQLGHNFIGTEHILLGLIREGEGVGAQVLVKLGAELVRTRQAVIGILQGLQGKPPLEKPPERPIWPPKLGWPWPPADPPPEPEPVPFSPPQGRVVEQTVLGAMLLDPDTIADALQRLWPGNFHWTHQHIYDAIAAMYKAGEPIDAVTVAAELDRRDLLLAVGGADYLNTLVAAGSTGNVDYHVGLIAERAEQTLLRQVKKRVERNSRDLGELGKVVRLEYVYEILDDLARALRHGHRT